jgi:hypothetical protein
MGKGSSDSGVFRFLISREITGYEPPRFTPRKIRPRVSILLDGMLQNFFFAGYVNGLPFLVRVSVRMTLDGLAMTGRSH